jgi:RsiW-degrading membrane proteinase PrsW (M82 family)
MVTTHALIIYGTLALCAIGVVAALRRYDMSPREPWSAVLTTVAIGAGMMWLAMFVQHSKTFNVVEWLDSPHANVRFAFAAALTEELAKLFAVGFVAVLFRKHFEEVSDGVVYGGLAGLGAAVFESVHVLGMPRGSILLPIEEPVRLAGHLIMGSISCAGLGLVAVRSRAGWWGVPVCFLLGFGLHFLWDVVAFETADQIRDSGKALWSQHVAAAGLMITGMVLFRVILLRGGVRIKG